MGSDPVITTIKRQVVWLIDRWDRFFFQPVDSLPLSILRILCGCMLLYTHSIWGKVLFEFFGETSWNSPELIVQMRGGGVTPSLWWYVPEDWMNTVHWSCNLVLVMFIFGLGGRITALITWMIAVSYAHRANLANFGLDQANCIFTFYLFLGPSTQYLSVDRWIAKRWLGGKVAVNRLSPSANVAMRLIQLHLCVIYLWAGLGKLQGEAWWTGEAMWLAIANQEYQSMDLTWLANYPRLLELLTHTTIAWELSFPFLVWPKATRWIVLGMGAVMHLGIGAFLGMWTFGSIMIFSYIAFASGAWIRQRFGFASNVKTQSDSVALQTGVNIPAMTNFVTHTDSNFDSQIHTKVRSVVLITTSQRCVDHFLRINCQIKVNWSVVSSIKEAESVAAMFPEATLLLLQMRSMNDSELEYLSIRVVKPKRTNHPNGTTIADQESKAKRAHPK